jgi:hypothetical protein
MSHEIKPVEVSHSEYPEVDDRKDDIDRDQPETQAAPKGRFARMFQNNGPKDGDLGARWLAEYTGPPPELTAENNKHIKWTIDKWLLPITCLIYLNQQLDKSSVSFGTSPHL